MRLISVTMGVDTQEHRTNDTVSLLNYGFNNYKLSTIYEKNKIIDKIRIEKSKNDTVNIILMNDATELLNINDAVKKYTINIKLDNISAPIKKGEKVGVAEIIDSEGNITSKVDVTVEEDVLKANLLDYFKKNIKIVVNGKNILK